MKARKHREMSRLDFQKIQSEAVEAGETRDEKGTSCNKIFIPNHRRALPSPEIPIPRRRHSPVRCHLQKCLSAQNHKAPAPTLPLFTPVDMKAQEEGPMSWGGKKKALGISSALVN